MGERRGFTQAHLIGVGFRTFCYPIDHGAGKYHRGSYEIALNKLLEVSGAMFADHESVTCSGPASFVAGPHPGVTAFVMAIPTNAPGRLCDAMGLGDEELSAATQTVIAIATLESPLHKLNVHQEK